MEGQRYTISDAEEAQEAQEAPLANALDEVTIEGAEEKILTLRIVERVKILMDTHYKTIKREMKLREKAVLLRTQLRKRITESIRRILRIVDGDPTSEEAKAGIKYQPEKMEPKLNYLS